MNFHFFIIDVPRFNGVTNDFTEIGVSLGQPASLRCELTANPKPVFKWFFEGAPVADWMNERLLEMGNVLIVTDVRNADAGRYMCTADNRIGIASQEFILTLNGKENECRSIAFYLYFVF